MHLHIVNLQIQPLAHLDTDQKELSDKYNLPITPPGWVFAVWGLIYIWQAAWQLFLLFDSVKFSYVSQNALLSQTHTHNIFTDKS